MTVAAINRLGSRLADSPSVIVTLALLLATAVLAIAGPWISPQDAQAMRLDRALAAPALDGLQLFGTDELGRDLFVRTMRGVQLSLAVAVIASLVSLVIGVIYGSVAGYVGGRLDATMMRFVDTLYALPFIFFVILLAAFFERSFLMIFIAIGAVNWLDMARIVRGQVLAIRERDYVHAARMAGVGTAAILWRHVVPNIAGVVVVYLTLTVPQALLVESFLSFLGLGVQEPAASLGSLVNDGVRQMEQAPHVLLIPATLLAFILLCFNFLGDGLRDLLDVRGNRQ